MAIFSWARPTPLSITIRLPADQPVVFISDLHLGDGTRSDSFLGKDRELIALLQKVRQDGTHLVIVGDAIDFHQAWAMSRVLKAHARLMGELAHLAQDQGVTYIWGNHDYDIKLFRDLLRFDVCSRLELGDKVLVQHGYEYDPFIGPNLQQTHVATRIHHLFERLLNTWIRLPLENFYNKANRLTFWLFHKLALAVELGARFQRRLGVTDPLAGARKVIWYWTQNQVGDPGCMFEPASCALTDSPYAWLVLGHSHLPGRIQIAPGKTYVNTGSWTFNSSQYATWDGEQIVVRDWISGQEHGEAAYLPLLTGERAHMDFLAWWRENHLGRMRYRVAEELLLDSER